MSNSSLIAKAGLRVRPVGGFNTGLKDITSSYLAAHLCESSNCAIEAAGDIQHALIVEQAAALNQASRHRYSRVHDLLASGTLETKIDISFAPDVPM